MQPKIHWSVDLAAVAANVSAVAAWQEQLDWVLRCLAASIAILAGSVALYQRLRDRKQVPLD